MLPALPIACGGTGGHLFPGLAVAEVLRARGHEVMLFVSEKEIDALAIAGRSEFRFQKLPTVGLPYYLGFFAGFLLYIGASDILPQAHSDKSTPLTIILTVLGVVFAFVVTRFV